jgi:hypothetical protein
MRFARWKLSKGVDSMPGDATIHALNELVLAASDWPELGREFDLLGDRPPDVPEQPGVYALLIKGEPLRYPRERSSVIYIGCAYGAKGLLRRLNEHWQLSKDCRREAESGKAEQDLFPPRYEWVNAAGGICLSSVAPAGGMGSQRMETLLLKCFEYMHYTLPTANGQHGAQYRDGEDPGRDSDLSIPPNRRPLNP